MFTGSARSVLRKTFTLLLSAIFAVAPLHAELARVGPNNPDPRVGSFPAWYQDNTGLTLEFCDPLNSSEVDGGWCLLLPGDVNIPEVFPTNFFDEHFYFAGDAALTPASGGKALLRVAVESAFSIGPPAIGDQITFARIRVKLTTIPVTGTYRFVHPYGEDAIDEVAGAARGIFFTDDVGIGLPGGPFDGLLNGRLGPFLLPSTAPGGPELPAVSAQNPTPDQDPAHFGGVLAPTPYPGTGKLYIADPARIGPVTGSSLPDFMACPNSNPCDETTGGTLRNHNIYRIEGPAGSGLGGPGVDFIETTDFTLMGRVFTDTIPGRVTIDRASYAQDNNGHKLDIFSTAFPTAPGRIPTQPTPKSVLPQLTFFDKGCNSALDSNGNPIPPFSAPTGAAEFQMFNSGTNFWGQEASSVPNSVCVKDNTSRDATGALVPAYFPKNVTDEVTINTATYDPSTGALSVTAQSSDETAPPTLTLLGFGKTPDTNLNNGSVTITSLAAPPAEVRVRSARGGLAERAVITRLGSTPNLPDTPVATNDAATFDEDSGAHDIDVLANDSGLGDGTTPPVVTITAQPRLGTAVVDTATNKVRYTPNLNAFGSDSFSYTVAVGSQVSNSASVTITLNPINDAPVAANDTFAAIANQAATLNVLSNDTDPDGNTDLANVVIVTPPVATVGTGTATATVGSGGNITFTATAAGTYTFTYQAKDVSGVASNTATVTVNVSGAEQVAIATAEFRTGQLRLRVSGTVSPVQGQTITVKWANGTNTTDIVATAVSDGTGAWAIDLRGVTAIQDPRNSGATSVVATGPGGGRQVLTLTIRN